MSRRKRNKFTKEMALGLALVAGLIAFLIAFEVGKMKVKAAMIDPSGPYPSFNIDTSYQKTNKPTVEEVKAYTRTIFGREWRTAWAVMEAECNHLRKEWPVCVNKWGNNFYEGEDSIGISQINIARQQGYGQKVHCDKVPGETLAEKELWLSDWKQNIMLAYKISEGGRNWNPWSAYTNKNYLKHL